MTRKTKRSTIRNKQESTNKTEDEPTVENKAHATMSVKCALWKEPPREFPPGTGSARIRAIVSSEKKWVNGTLLRYYFFDRPHDGEYVELRDGSRVFVPWVGTEAKRDVARKAFDVWADVGIGLQFVEVSDREDAEVRIGFMAGDGHWSFLGRDILKYKSGHRTMNLDGSLTGQDGLDTALHEIGHTIGMAHEHQNPYAGIVWDEPEVYRRLAEAPNYWDADTTYYNILRKIAKHEVSGTEWDSDSIMHYAFEAGMIRHPTEYQTTDLRPAPGLSSKDKAWALKTYPPTNPLDALPRLVRYSSIPVELAEGEQFDAVLLAEETGRHRIQSFGETDMILTLFEDTPDGPQFIAGDDDSGEDRNATLSVRLIKGCRYIVRARLMFDRSGGKCALMVH